MDFITLKDKFLVINQDYSNDVVNFLNYMENIKKLSPLPLYQDLLVNSMRTETIIESLKYYVDIGQIKKQEPAKKYFVSIGQLFEYILNDASYQNSDLKDELGNPTTRINSYTRKTNDFVNNCKELSPKETQAPLEDDDVQKLIEWCDKQIERDFSNLDILDETRYKRINACICMKLMILTGITYREARKLEIDNLNVMESTININSYIIRLPKKLSCQFNKYYKIREKYNLIKNRYLFNTFNGDQWGDKTSASGIPSFLKTAILKTTILSISKYGIIQLIKCGINDSVIMNLTGASREIMNDCISSIEQDPTERYINSKIVNVEKYYQL